MSAYTESYHTHAKGSTFGWWGQATHPAHLIEPDNPNSRFIQGTEWQVNAKAATLEAAFVAVHKLIVGKLHGEIVCLL